jgi:hypothetical protein
MHPTVVGRKDAKDFFVLQTFVHIHQILAPLHPGALALNSFSGVVMRQT